MKLYSFLNKKISPLIPLQRGKFDLFSASLQGIKGRAQAITLLFLFFFTSSISAQMETDQGTLYGNEWINYNQSYYKITIVKEGLYRLTKNDLAAVGIFNTSTIPKGKDFQLFYQGEEMPIYVSNSNEWGDNDYLEFYAQKNKGEIDQYLYEEKNQQLNPAYSLFTDTASYFLTWNPTVEKKRILDMNNDLNNLPTSETHCFVSLKEVYHNYYSRGKKYVSSDGWAARFDLVEGWSNNTFSNNQNITINLQNLFNTNDKSKLMLRFFSEKGDHEITIKANGLVVKNDSYQNWAVKSYHIEIPTNQLQNGNNNIEIQGTANEEDKFRLVSYDLKYPHNFDFENKAIFSFDLPQDENRRYLEISNFKHGGLAPILYDLNNQIRIPTKLEGSIVKVVLPAISKAAHLILVSQSSINSTINLQKRNFTQYDFANGNYDYLILSHKDLFKPINGVNQVQAYADYRASAAGGNFKPLVIDVTQVYDQFGYGIRWHQMAIKNFMALASKHWNSSYLFILGKGVDHVLMRSHYENWKQFDFVPSFGQPHSDYLFVSKTSKDVARMAVGRIAAKSPEDVQLYLNKVKEFEATANLPQTIEAKAWMKRVLHFGGGDANIQDFIASGLNNLKDILENSQHGGDVKSFFKNSTDVIQSSQVEDVKKNINQGTGLLTFFGHSAPNTLDFDVGSPEEYENKGKYPLFFAVGCNTNRMFEKDHTLSEDFVLIKDKGAIGFFGTTWLTTLGNVNNYAKVFYENFGEKNYGKSIGKIIQETIRDYSSQNNFFAIQIRNTYMLHGDPALKIYPSKTPDYLVDISKTKTNPAVVDLQSDSFALELSIINIGKAIPDSITVLIEQEKANASRSELKTIRLKAPSFEAKYIIQLPLEDKDILGINQLVITIDPQNKIVETPSAAELNNQSRISFVAIANDVKPVAPREFSIVSNNTITLRASTTNPFSNLNNYIFEIDTTELFDSPLKESSIVSASGGIVEWTPDLSLQNKVVYYWRVAVQNINGENPAKWNGSSFVYLDGKGEGWNQSHKYQWVKNQSSGISLNLSLATFNYDEIVAKFNIINGAFGPINWEDVAIFKNGFRQFGYAPCPSGGNGNRWIWAFDYKSTDLEIRKIPEGATSFHCFGTPEYIVIKKANSSIERNELINFIENDVPINDYVIVWTTQSINNNYHADQWAADSSIYGVNLFQTLKKYGAKKVDDLVENQTPYIFVFQKGNPDFQVVEAHAQTIDEVLDIEANLIGISPSGSLTSPKIGPAKSWQSLFWQISKQETHDQVSIDIFGINQENEEVLLHKNLLAFDTTLAHIDAQQYPYLKLRWNSQDTVNRTSPQLDYWRVFYEPYPEAALAPNMEFSFHADTLQRGDALKLTIAIENMSEVDMDSLLVKYTITDAQNVEQISSIRMTPLLKAKNLSANFEFDTQNLSGANRLTIEVNPNNDQPELFHFNNIGIKEFFVKTDHENPLLDVTFDGIHIMNGDLVSAKPNVLVHLKDENKFLALNDTSLFSIRVQYPDGQIKRFYIDDDILTFFPANEADLENKNEAQLEFKPTFETDGTYTLIVQGKDKSGNKSGDYEYRVDFEIINEQMVSNVFNYPNPFSSSTQFVFTLTGDQIPDFMKIQIMTASGKIVREISQEELGPIHVGHNQTQFKWDGTDEFGDQLANGVYLYRVITRKSDGKLYENFDTNTNQFFKSGIGKMVLMR